MRAEKRIAIDTPPELLVIHLKRFSFLRGSFSQKDTRPIAFRQTLELDGGCINASAAQVAAVQVRIYM